MLESPCQVHGVLECLGGAELDVNADVVRQATHEEVHLLLRRQLRRVAHHGVEALLVVLDGAVPGESCQLRETIGPDGRPKALGDELLEVLLGWHALVLLEGVVSGLSHARHVV